ncbi:unknown protein [Microcystis aeruginosa NIES-87]|jgi:putative sterol carrier protein|uniref:hypothetical protein n=1 Tax=Microcystis TaxID=1125 RepID=UPI000CB415FF|nr:MULTISPECIES: hypothetical protein [Microcystis]MCA2720234.1 hypothetical protein [Microcystis sp. M169S2]WNF16660.1 hypothetical protein RKE53_10020 [Microcystis aeruginosa NRERC-214]GBE72806.1 unknown protein [Microcystis aeruginosa NIES-87]
MNQPLTRFSQEWWSAYQTTWNEQENLDKKFAKLGKVILWFSDHQGVSVCSEWDDQGQIVSLELIEDMDESLPIFSATRENWERFVNQEIGAVKAVMTGLIDYQGSMTIIVKYGRHFDCLAEVAQKVN